MERIVKSKLLKISLLLAICTSFTNTQALFSKKAIKIGKTTGYSIAGVGAFCSGAGSSYILKLLYKRTDIINKIKKAVKIFVNIPDIVDKHSIFGAKALFAVSAACSFYTAYRMFKKAGKVCKTKNKNKKLEKIIN